MATGKAKKGPFILLGALVLVGGILGGNYWLKNHGEVQQQSSTVKVAGDLEGFKEADAPANAAPVDPSAFKAPSAALARAAGPKVKMLVIPWNALAGLNLANGGTSTTEGSLMQKNGVNLVIERQDDYGKMKEALVAFASELKGGARNPASGAHFVVIMGDAGASFMTGLNNELAKIGPQYVAEIVGGVGRSYGEDKFMVPPAVRDNPKSMAGLLVSGVLLDGDWNLALYYARANGVCNNPDVKTYNPDCLNWLGTSSFGDADKAYIAGTCEDRPVVKNDPATGKTKRTGETKKVCVNAVVTWFPGDEEVFTNKGGLVNAISTRENDSQMATAIIGIKAWNTANRPVVEGILAAGLEGGNQIKRYGDKALMAASEVSAKVFAEKDAKYWKKYYRGVTETDSQGNEVRLGGSQAFNLATAAKYFGLVEGSANAYADAYTLFGKIMQEQYPNELPTFLPVSDVLNTSYLQAVLNRASKAEQGTVQEVTFDEGEATGQQIAKRSYSINFQTGKAALTQTGVGTVEEVRTVVGMSDNTIIEVHGYTDNVGDPAFNQTLSAARADAVKQYLEGKYPENFRANRIKTRGHGEEDAVASNSTEAGRAQNRRVVIVIKAND